MLRNLLAVQICALNIGLCFGQLPENPRHSDDKIRALREAESMREYTRAYNDLFKNATSDELEDYIANPDCSLAFAAAWERLQRVPPGTDQATDQLIESAKYSRFVGVVEGRTQVPLPQAWATLIQAETSNSRWCSRVSFPLHPKDFVDQVNKGHFGECATQDILQTKNQTVLKYSDREWSLPAQAGLGFIATIQRTETTDFVALYNWPPIPYTLYAIDNATAKPIWSACVQGESHGWYEGAGWHFVEFRIHDQTLIVFGISGCAYIEGFDTKTGKNLFRFRTIDTTQ